MDRPLSRRCAAKFEMAKSVARMREFLQQSLTTRLEEERCDVSMYCVQQYNAVVQLCYNTLNYSDRMNSEGGQGVVSCVAFI